MSGHTPGPWGIGEDQELAVHANGVWLADVRGSTDEHFANARLMAAAPALLEAAGDLLMTHAAHRSEAGEGACDCDACTLFRPLVEALS